jgi:ATP-dependent DNA helicase RecG
MRQKDRPITELKGVGPARAKALHRLGIDTVSDAVHYLPRDYRDLTRADRLADIRQGEEAVIVAAVATKPQTHRPKKNLTVVKAILDDGTGRCAAVWYNQPWIATALPKGSQWVFVGRAEARFGEKTLQNPAYEPYSGDLPGILPIYPATEAVGQKALRGLVQEALAAAGPLEDPLPQDFRMRHGLAEINFALQTIHRPQTYEAAAEARRRLAFEELALFLVMLRSLKEARCGEVRGTPFLCTQQAIDRFAASLPFRLTNAQSRVLGEIVSDMCSHTPMNRLVQGDVGSGKTAIALGALYLAACEGRQGAFMAPTEILASQHYESLKQTLEPLGIPVGLLKHSMKGAEKREALDAIKTGRWQVVAGTHALIEKAVAFRDLGLVVTDEQHRFGVRQRAALGAKGEAPDMLVMSATPVPRTLALILYGDLDISIVDELPPGRKPTLTRIVPPEKRADMYRYIREQAVEGKQTFVVCPLIEESDKLDAEAAIALYDELRDGLLRGVGMALVHGRMSAAEKDAGLEAFRVGSVKVLVSTTVIEVGVNIPNASIMIVENADRFGLAQLHQLRGRVGRGGQRAWCFLSTGAASPDSVERLRIMTETADGFKVAEADLEHRGPGEFLGARQSGMIDMHVMRYLKDVKLLSHVDRAVREVSEKPELSGERARLMEAARDRFERKLEGIVLN